MHDSVNSPLGLRRVSWLFAVAASISISSFILEVAKLSIFDYEKLWTWKPRKNFRWARLTHCKISMTKKIVGARLNRDGELRTFTDDDWSDVHSSNYEYVKQEHVQVLLPPTGTPVSRFQTTPRNVIAVAKYFIMIRKLTSWKLINFVQTMRILK